MSGTERKRPARPSRRTVLGWAGAVGAVTALPLGGGVGWLYAQAERSNTGDVDLANPLHIPPLLEPEEDAEGGLRFHLRAVSGETELRPGRMTPTWGYNGSYLGPTLRAERGRAVTVEVTNELEETTTTHWHGMRLPAVMDGGPHQPIEPGETWAPTWTVDQPAATLWYHPHLHHSTAEHVYRGMAGLFLIDDEQSAGLGLPDEYGVDDIPLILQDKKFLPEGELDTGGLKFGGTDITGLLGDTILVNGTYAPTVSVDRERVRFRLLNGSNARVYDVGFTDDKGFDVIATDVGLLREPVRAQNILLSPGERAEIVVSFTPGERAVLRSRPPDLGANLLYERLAGGDDTMDLLAVVAKDELRSAPALPNRLVEHPAIELDADSPVREFVMGDFTFNGRTMDHERIDVVVAAGSVEIWEIINAGGAPGNGLPHNFHIHEVAFEVLDIDGREPSPDQRGRKDTVYVPPKTTVRLAVPFGSFTDSENPYMYHCHFLAHEDAGMMGQFLVVAEEDLGGFTEHGDDAHAGHD